MKGYTNIPYVRQAAELMMYPEKYEPDYATKDLAFHGRVYHLENRYWSIDQLLNELPVKNILELSSGFSFRGLDMVKRKDVYYIDTDLLEMTATKQRLINEIPDANSNWKGKLELLPLNALDETRLHEVVNRFPPGEIAIVNEGLLMYLEEHEKKKLCRTIHSVLKERGGCWITADVYVQRKMNQVRLNDEFQKFADQHRVEEKKFASFSSAREFFREAGFTVEKVAKVDQSKITSRKYLLKKVSFWQMLRYLLMGKIQATWRLRTT